MLVTFYTHLDFFFCVCYCYVNLIFTLLHTSNKNTILIYMKLTLQTPTLKNITNTFLKASSRDGLQSSSFNGMCIQVSSGKALFRLSRLGFGVVYTIDVQDSVEGAVFLPIQVFDGVVSSLVDTTATISLEGKKLIVATNTSTSDIYILDEYEEVDTLEGRGGITPSFMLRREVLIQGFRSVQHAAAESVVKPEIASVYLYTKDDSIYFVATDAFRLSESRFLCDTFKDSFEVIVPIKNVIKILRVLESVSDTMVGLSVGDDGLCIITDNVFIKTSSVKGSFPDYKAIMPTSFDAVMTFLKGDVSNFLKKARLFSDRLNKVSLEILKDKKSVAMSFSNDAVGVTRDVIPFVFEGSVDALPSFNYKFVNDALSIISDDRIVVSVVDDTTKPIMLRGSEDSSFTSIISPLLDTKER